MIKQIKNYHPIIFGLLFALLYELPFIVLGEDSHIYITDNLDAMVSCFLRMVQNNQIFDFQSTIPQLMNGLPRVFIANGINISVFWYIFFKPFTAYVLNDFAVHWIAYTGMHLLLKQHTKLSNNLLIIGISAAWSFIPFLSIYGISSAGQPLLAYAFLNLKENKLKLTSYLIILFFPLYSMLVFIGFFIIPAIGLFAVYKYVFERKLYYHLFIGLILLSTAYIIIEFQLIELFLFNKKLTSHRTEWNPAYVSTNFKNTISIALQNFTKGNFHSPSSHILILCLSLLYLTIVTLKKGFKSQESKIVFFSLVILFIFNLAFSFCNWEGLIPLKENIPFLKTFQINRFIWLTPIFWYLLLAFVLWNIQHFQYGKAIIVIFLSMQIIYTLLYNSELQFQANRLFNLKTATNISYKEFFAEHQFKEIKDFIDKPQNTYRTLSLGIHPAISQYSGFYTLDSYQNNYLLSYKHEFRDLMAEELSQSKEWREYFDFWGNRCYLFSSEIPKSEDPFLTYKTKGIRIKNLRLNTKKFKNMQGKYLFSAVEILNAEDIELKLLRVFENVKSPWRIYLYEVM